jgi:hypothetical protein
MIPASIPSPWLPIAAFLTELVAHASKLLITKKLDQIFEGRVMPGPNQLLRLRAHFDALKTSTDALAEETHGGALSSSYSRLREKWVERFAPAQTVLHNFDPTALSSLGVYAPELADLLKNELVVSEQGLIKALESELREIQYDSESHLCTLCLHLVRTWSNKKTIAEGLHVLSEALTKTLVCLDSFITTNWTVKEVAASAN